MCFVGMVVGVLPIPLFRYLICTYQNQIKSSGLNAHSSHHRDALLSSRFLTDPR